MSNDWCTIESDPGVFTCLIESFGVKGAELSELWSLDEDSLMQLGKVYGLIFLFKWEQEHQTSSGSGDDGGNINRVPLTEDEIPSDLFFARQTVTNACATQAILSVLLNAADTNSSDLTLGPVLSEFKSFTSSFPPYLKGEAIGGSEEIRVSHNSFSRNDPFLVDERKRPQTESGDVFHFIAYIPKNGKVYELDGLQPGPIVVGNYEDVTPKANGDSGAEGSSLAPAASFDMDSLAWLPVARAAIQERIERYSASEIKFNLMAVVQDKRAILEKRQNQLTKEAGMADDEPSVQELKAQLEQEAEKRRLWESENQRRRHNYLPFCVELLKALAGSGKLPTLTEEARERVSSKKRKMEGQGK